METVDIVGEALILSDDTCTGTIVSLKVVATDVPINEVVEVKVGCEDMVDELETLSVAAVLVEMLWVSSCVLSIEGVSTMEEETPLVDDIVVVSKVDKVVDVTIVRMSSGLCTRSALWNPLSQSPSALFGISASSPWTTARPFEPKYTSYCTAPISQT